MLDVRFETLIDRGGDICAIRRDRGRMLGDPWLPPYLLLLRCNPLLNASFSIEPALHLDKLQFGDKSIVSWFSWSTVL